jgi:HEAT repeat protein
MGNSAKKSIFKSGVILMGNTPKKKETGILFGIFSYFLLFLFLAGFGSLTFAQTPEQIKYYSERIQYGTEDVKRDALFDLRNFRTEKASRIALPALKDSSEIIRATATHTIIFLPKEESARALLPLLMEKAEFIRKETVLALGQTKNPNVAGELIQILENDKESEVIVAATVALGQSGNPMAIPSLIKILDQKPKESRRFLRRSAARSIGQIAETVQLKNLTLETPESFLPTRYKQTTKFKYIDLAEKKPVFTRAIPLLIKFLQNKKEFPNTKREIAFALGAIGSRIAIPVLQTNLKNEDYYLAEICQESLLKIAD